MRSCCAISGHSSMLTLTSFTAPAALRTTRSSNGVSCLHGPHHGAQKSTSTGTVIEASTTSAMKVLLVASLITSAAAAAAAPPPFIPMIDCIASSLALGEDNVNPGPATTSAGAEPPVAQCPSPDAGSRSSTCGRHAQDLKSVGE